MKIISREEVEESLSYPGFIEVLAKAFASRHTMPPRQVLPLAPGGHDAFAMLPVWDERVIALKAFTYFPENPPPHPSLHSKILVFDRAHGVPLALVDGTAVTYWRTAGVSALASRHLSREDSEAMLLLGTGRLAPYLIRAHASVRPLKKVLLWGRNPDKARHLAKSLQTEFSGLEIDAVPSIQAACEVADIVVAATGSPQVLVHGEWLRPGMHLDCLGNHHAHLRECDTMAVLRSRVYVDTKVNCFKEAGELLVPVDEGVFGLHEVVGEMAELCRAEVPGRQSREEITFFKSVGCALGDLAGALAVMDAC
ncbi:MAG: ornithine cyclodeaminase family protein [Akkermansiaceae bacterium]|jgi:1-pyrroline-2-carboxylate reductase [NAD(P)H]|nr:ornithine cyclodeaminase family protein [Akkermansiaceae bacterium]